MATNKARYLKGNISISNKNTKFYISNLYNTRSISTFRLLKLSQNIYILHVPKDYYSKSKPYKPLRPTRFTITI